MIKDGKTIPDITIDRAYLPDCTPGVLTSLVGFRCSTLELPKGGNEKDVSCILPGLYPYFYRDDGKNGRVLELVGTVNRTNVQIHIANWCKDILGCIAVGETFTFDENDNAKVYPSGPTMTELLNRVPHEGHILIR